MNVIIRLVVMLGLIGSFNAQAMKNIKSKNFTKFGKIVFNKNIQKKSFPKTSFSTSALFNNQKFNTIPKNFSAKKFDSIPKNYSTVPEIKNIGQYENNDQVKEKFKKTPIMISGDEVSTIPESGTGEKPIKVTLQEYWDIKGPDSFIPRKADPLWGRVKDWDKLIRYNYYPAKFDYSFTEPENVFNRWKVVYDLYSLPVDQSVPADAFDFGIESSNSYGTTIEKYAYIPQELKPIKRLSSVDDESTYHIKKIRDQKRQEIIDYGLREDSIRKKVQEFLKQKETLSMPEEAEPSKEENTLTTGGKTIRMPSNKSKGSRSYSTVPEIKNIDEESESYENNKLIKGDKFYGQSIDKILEKAYKNNHFLNSYVELLELYQGYRVHYKKNDETNQYDAYRAKKYQTLKDLVTQNTDYRKKIEDYIDTLDTLDSRDTKTLTDKIKKTKEEINKKEYEYQEKGQIPLNYFKIFLDKSPFISEYRYDTDTVIAGRLLHLMNTLIKTTAKKNIYPEDILHNPYFRSASHTIKDDAYYRIYLNRSESTPPLDVFFNEACKSFTIPQTLDDYVNFIKEPFLYAKITPIERIFGDALVKDYLAWSDAETTADNFVQFLNILQKMKTDENFRNSVIKIWKINEIDNDFKKMFAERKKQKENNRSKKENNLSIWERIRNYF